MCPKQKIRTLNEPIMCSKFIGTYPFHLPIFKVFYSYSKKEYICR